MGQDFDLWGDPIPPPTERRGRPAHEVTEEKRLRVSVLRAHNKTNLEIAEAMGISERTLRTFYLPELKAGLAQKRAEVLVMLWKEARRGNVAAMKAALAELARSDLNVPRAPQAKKLVRLGKKEQALVDAAPDVSTSMGELMERHAARGRAH